MTVTKDSVADISDTITINVSILGVKVTCITSRVSSQC